MTMNEASSVLKKAQEAVHHQISINFASNEDNTVRGPDFDQINDQPQISTLPDRLSLLLGSYGTLGFQATKLAQAISQVNAMRSWRPDVGSDQAEDPSRNFCKIFLGYTSNQVSCGNREVIKYLVKHRMVHVLVTTAGGIEEDFIKCLKPTLLGEFNLEGRMLRGQGMNRIGNLIIPNENYCAFEDWLMPILDRLVVEQKEQGKVWSPSSLIHRLGLEINNEDSIYYWAAKNNIPVFCPAITDGSLGDMIFFHSFKQDAESQLVLDLVQDIRLLNCEAMRAGCSGIICLGGGVVKHHICNANLMRNGAEYAVFINTGQEFDGSDSGASPDEAISWGKIRIDAKPVKVCSDASIAFPLLVAETFAKDPLQQRIANQNVISESLYL